jgi:hypothetical protein
MIIKTPETSNALNSYWQGLRGPVEPLWQINSPAKIRKFCGILLSNSSFLLSNRWENRPILSKKERIGASKWQVFGSLVRGNFQFKLLFTFAAHLTPWPVHEIVEGSWGRPVQALPGLCVSVLYYK